MSWRWERIREEAISLPALVLELNDQFTKLSHSLKAPLTQSLTAAGTVDVTTRDVWVDATSGAVTVTLPPLAVADRVVTISKRDASANAVTVDGDGSETINGSATLSLPNQYDVARLVPGPTEWGIG